jgi:phage-related protein
MADAGLSANVDKKTVSYVVAGVFCVYALVYKIPIPCFGCQKNGFWYRCVMDTGEGTESCAAYKQAENRFDTAGRIMDQAGVYMDNLWDFTKTELPGVIKDFIADLKNQILGLKDKMANKVNEIIAFLREKLALFVSKMKDVATYTYDKFMEVVINPIIKFFVANLLQPCLKIFEKIMEFRELVWRTLSNAIDKFANIPIGDFVGDVVDVFKQIPEVMGKLKGVIVKVVNTIKNKTIGVVNTGIRESIKGVELSVNKTTGVIDDGVNLAIDGLNKVKDELVSNLNKSINGMAGGIEKAVNTTTGGIETDVNKSVGGMTGGINSSMNKVEQGVGKVMETTNDVIKGAEIAVNTISCGINNALNKVGDGVNNVTDGVNSAVNKVIDPVNSVVRTIAKAQKTHIGYNKGFVKINFRPLDWMRAPREVSKIDIDDVDLPNIPVEKFGRIKESLNIPDITYKGIDIPPLDIPTVDINAPKDIKKIDIPDIEIPSASIPIPADIKEEDLDLPAIPGFGFVSEKVKKIKESVIDIFETAMAPLYDGVAYLIGLVSNVIASTVHFFKNYLTWTAIRSRVEWLTEQAGNGVRLLKDLVVDEIVPGFIRLIETIKDPILDFVKLVADQTWRVMKKIGTNVGTIFNEAYRVIVKVTGVIAKGVFHTGLYVVGTTVEKYTGWLPLPISVKILLIVASITWMLFGGFLKNGKMIVDLIVSAVQGAAVALTDLDYQLDLKLGMIKQGVPAVASSLLYV